MEYVSFIVAAGAVVWLVVVLARSFREAHRSRKEREERIRRILMGKRRS